LLLIVGKMNVCPHNAPPIVFWFLYDETPSFLLDGISCRNWCL